MVVTCSVWSFLWQVFCSTTWPCWMTSCSTLTWSQKCSRVWKSLAILSFSVASLNRLMLVLLTSLSLSVCLSFSVILSLYHTHTHKYTHTHIHTHMHTHACTHACTHAGMHACTHAGMHARTRAHTHTHTHTHTRYNNIHCFLLLLVCLLYISYWTMLFAKINVGSVFISVSEDYPYVFADCKLHSAALNCCFCLPGGHMFFIALIFSLQSISFRAMDEWKTHSYLIVAATESCSWLFSVNNT